MSSAHWKTWEAISQPREGGHTDENRRGLRTEPWGTPTERGEEKLVVNDTEGAIR